MLETAGALVSGGFRDAGYNTVGIDDCWLEHGRDAEGRLQPHGIRFPRGIKYIADALHAQ